MISMYVLVISLFVYLCVVFVLSCEVLEDNGHPDPFHGMRAICYNGRHQHEYLLDYIDMYHDTHIRSGTWHP